MTKEPKKIKLMKRKFSGRNTTKDLKMVHLTHPLHPKRYKTSDDPTAWLENSQCFCSHPKLCSHPSQMKIPGFC